MPRCLLCHRLFRPHPRIGKAQKTCSREICQRARKRANLRRWRVLHPDCVKQYAKMMPAWAKAYPDYWRQYRRKHPAYYRKDLTRRRKAYHAARSSANETLIAAIARRKLQALADLQTPGFSANETPIGRRIDLVVDYLVWQGVSAKETSMVPRGVRDG